MTLRRCRSTRHPETLFPVGARCPLCEAIRRQRPPGDTRQGWRALVSREERGARSLPNEELAASGRARARAARRDVRGRYL